jgi:1-acyl-sn-glycerol-3-phosphate acyltransferase
MLTPWRAAALDSVNHLLGISREQRLARAMQNETHLAMVGLQVSMAAMARYHRYRVQGLSNIPQQGRCIVAINHSFATYDAFLLAFAIKKSSGRLMSGLGDNLLFNLPLFSPLASAVNLYRANHQNGRRLLENECLLGVMPGGMREALRPASQKYQIRWQARKGFARLALITQSPVILAACPQADDIYDVKVSALTKFAYKHFKLPLAWPIGLAGSLISRPIKNGYAANDEKQYL